MTELDNTRIRQVRPTDDDKRLAYELPRPTIPEATANVANTIDDGTIGSPQLAAAQADDRPGGTSFFGQHTFEFDREGRLVAAEEIAIPAEPAPHDSTRVTVRITNNDGQISGEVVDPPADAGTAQEPIPPDATTALPPAVVADASANSPTITLGEGEPSGANDPTIIQQTDPSLLASRSETTATDPTPITGTTARQDSIRIATTKELPIEYRVEQLGLPAAPYTVIDENRTGIISGTKEYEEEATRESRKRKDNRTRTYKIKGITLRRPSLIEDRRRHTLTGNDRIKATLDRTCQAKANNITITEKFAIRTGESNNDKKTINWTGKLTQGLEGMLLTELTTDAETPRKATVHAYSTETADITEYRFKTKAIVDNKECEIEEIVNQEYNRKNKKLTERRSRIVRKENDQELLVPDLIDDGMFIFEKNLFGWKRVEPEGEQTYTTQKITGTENHKTIETHAYEEKDGRRTKHTITQKQETKLGTKWTATKDTTEYRIDERDETFNRKSTLRVYEKKEGENWQDITPIPQTAIPAAPEPEQATTRTELNADELADRAILEFERAAINPVPTYVLGADSILQQGNIVRINENGQTSWNSQPLNTRNRSYAVSSEPTLAEEIINHNKVHSQQEGQKTIDWLTEHTVVRTYSADNITERFSYHSQQTSQTLDKKIIWTPDNIDNSETVTVTTYRPDQDLTYRTLQRRQEETRTENIDTYTFTTTLEDKIIEEVIERKSKKDAFIVQETRTKYTYTQNGNEREISNIFDEGRITWKKVKGAWKVTKSECDGIETIPHSKRKIGNRYRTRIEQIHREQGIRTQQDIITILEDPEDATDRYRIITTEKWKIENGRTTGKPETTETTEIYDREKNDWKSYRDQAEQAIPEEQTLQDDTKTDSLRRSTPRSRKRLAYGLSGVAVGTTAIALAITQIPTDTIQREGTPEIIAPPGITEIAIETPETTDTTSLETTITETHPENVAHDTSPVEDENQERLNELRQLQEEQRIASEQVTRDITEDSRDPFRQPPAYIDTTVVESPTSSQVQTTTATNHTEPLITDQPELLVDDLARGDLLPWDDLDEGLPSEDDLPGVEAQEEPTPTEPEQALTPAYQTLANLVEQQGRQKTLNADKKSTNEDHHTDRQAYFALFGHEGTTYRLTVTRPLNNIGDVDGTKPRKFFIQTYNEEHKLQIGIKDIGVDGLQEKDAYLLKASKPEEQDKDLIAEEPTEEANRQYEQTAQTLLELVQDEIVDLARPLEPVKRARQGLLEIANWVMAVGTQTEEAGQTIYAHNITNEHGSINLKVTDKNNNVPDVEDTLEITTDIDGKTIVYRDQHLNGFHDPTAERVDDEDLITHDGEVILDKNTYNFPWTLLDRLQIHDVAYLLLTNNILTGLREDIQRAEQKANEQREATPDLARKIAQWVIDKGTQQNGVYTANARLGEVAYTIRVTSKDNQADQDDTLEITILNEENTIKITDHKLNGYTYEKLDEGDRITSNIDGEDTLMLPRDLTEGIEDPSSKELATTLTKYVVNMSSILYAHTLIPLCLYVDAQKVAEQRESPSRPADSAPATTDAAHTDETLVKVQTDPQITRLMTYVKTQYDSVDDATRKDGTKVKVYLKQIDADGTTYTVRFYDKGENGADNKIGPEDTTTVMWPRKSGGYITLLDDKLNGLTADEPGKDKLIGSTTYPETGWTQEQKATLEKAYRRFLTQAEQEIK